LAQPESKSATNEPILANELAYELQCHRRVLKRSEFESSGYNITSPENQGEEIEIKKFSESIESDQCCVLSLAGANS